MPLKFKKWDKRTFAVTNYNKQVATEPRTSEFVWISYCAYQTWLTFGTGLFKNRQVHRPWFDLVKL